MKRILFSLLLASLFTITQSTQCNKARDLCDGQYKTDTVLLNLNLLNPSAEYRQYDTIWINSDINDNFNPVSGNPASFSNNIEQLYLTIQPYQVKTDAALPYLQYANIEFNPVVRDGSLENVNTGGYIFKFRRVSPYNKVSAGLVAGRPGLYLIECNHSTYPYAGGGNFQIYNGNNGCVSFWGKSEFPPGQQNIDLWNSFGSSSLSIPQNYGNQIVNESSRNYVLFKVVP